VLRFPPERNAQCAAVYLTRALVDLDAVAANIRAISRLVDGAGLMAVVKANGYGHGSVMVARAAVEAGATWLGVYGLDEGIVLRRNGLDGRVLVFGPWAPERAAEVVHWNLTPTVTTRVAAEALQHAASSVPIPIHIKVDTGLERAGVSFDEAGDFAQGISKFSALRIEGVFTHFVASELRDKRLTRVQLRRFRSTVDDLRQRGIDPPILHAANSGAVLDMPESYFSLVRPGIATYGVYPSDDIPHALLLRPALSLVSTLTRVHEVPEGSGVGYGPEHICRRRSRIGLAPIGYGAIPRTLSRDSADQGTANADRGKGFHGSDHARCHRRTRRAGR
jgi:alanine racemase